VLIEQYDKVLAVVVLVGLLFSLLWLTCSKEKRQQDERAYQVALNALTPRPLESTGFDIGLYSNAVQQLVRPRQIALDASDVGFFVPERRVWCVACGRPIPYTAVTCPFPSCLEKQPPLDGEPVPDTDDDGMLDIWERQYGFDPFDPSDAVGDPDGDGFTNLSEFLDATDPRDAASHPPVDVLLRVHHVSSKRIPLALRGKSKMPNGKFLCQFSSQDGDRRSVFVNEGDLIGDTGFILITFTEREEKRPDPTLGMRTLDTSVAEIKRLKDEKVFVLAMNDEEFAETVAELILPLDGSIYPVVAGGTFFLRNERYNVISVDNKAQSVVIQNNSSSEQLTLGR